MESDLGETKGKLVESNTQSEQKAIELLPNTAYYIEIYLASNGKGQYIFSLLDNDPDVINPPMSEEPGIDDSDPVAPVPDEPGSVTPMDPPSDDPGDDDSSDPGIDDLWPDDSWPDDPSDPGTDENPTDFPKQKLVQDFTIKYGFWVTRQVGFVLTQKVTGNKTDIQYESSNTKVATVSENGKITCKAIGTTVITVTAIESDEYEAATKTFTLTVVPKKVGVKSMKSTKKGQIVVTSDITMTGNHGYQIQYKNKDTTKRVSVKTSKRSVTKILRGLKSGTKVQVRIRAYKKVNGKTIYGPYGNWKNIKVR